MTEAMIRTGDVVQCVHTEPSMIDVASSNINSRCQQRHTLEALVTNKLIGFPLPLTLALFQVFPQLVSLGTGLL